MQRAAGVLGHHGLHHPQVYTSHELTHTSLTSPEKGDYVPREILILADGPRQYLSLKRQQGPGELNFSSLWGLIWR